MLGISLDEMARPELAAFVKNKAIPWTICRDADLPHRMADYYGIPYIPTLILVSRDGSVVSLHARGEELAPLLERTLAMAYTATARSSAKKRAELKKLKSRLTSPKEVALKKAEETPKTDAPTLREWSDASGTYHMSAKFRGLAQEMVRLETEDGRVISISLEKLSDEDQDYIRQRKR